MVDLSFSRDCTSKNELKKSLKKSIWPPGSRKWLGTLTDDVSLHPGQSSSSFSQQMSRLFYIVSASEESSPKGAPSTWLMMYCIVISYDLKL